MGAGEALEAWGPDELRLALVHREDAGLGVPVRNWSVAGRGGGIGGQSAVFAPVTPGRSAECALCLQIRLGDQEPTQRSRGLNPCFQATGSVLPPSAAWHELLVDKSPLEVSGVGEPQGPSTPNPSGGGETLAMVGGGEGFPYATGPRGSACSRGDSLSGSQLPSSPAVL